MGCPIYCIKSRYIGKDRTGDRITEAMGVAGLGLGWNVEGNSDRRQKHINPYPTNVENRVSS